MSHRLTRMFSKTSNDMHKDTAEAAAKYKTESVNGSTSLPENGAARPGMPQRQGSQDQKDMQESERRISMLGGNKAKELDTAHMQHKRFEVNEDGTHSHFLKSAKRQEKLSDMLRDMLGAGKKKDHEGDQQLSLMSSWVDQLRSEREALASDKKGGPNHTENLVQKYGKCQEIGWTWRIWYRQDITQARPYRFEKRAAVCRQGVPEKTSRDFEEIPEAPDLRILHLILTTSPPMSSTLSTSCKMPKATIVKSWSTAPEAIFTH